VVPKILLRQRQRLRRGLTMESEVRVTHFEDENKDIPE
jgi:hypothetical protein